MKEGDTPQTSIQDEDLELYILVDGEPQDIYNLNNTPNVVPKVGCEYQVKLVNNRSHTVMSSLYVDGIDVMGGGKMILDQYEDFTWSGFSKDDSKISAFTFAKLQTKEENKKTLKIPDYNIGLISCRVYKCEDLGPLPSSNKRKSCVSEEKDMTQGVNDKKKSNVVTGEGRKMRDNTILSERHIIAMDMISTLEIRYNGIGFKLSKAEIDEEFTNDIDYE